MKKREIQPQKFYKKYISLGIPLLFVLALLLPNCGKETTEPEPVVYPDSNLSFNEHIHPIFLSNCATSGCHESVSPAKGLDLETLTPSFISVNGPMIIPFNASQSRLYRLLLSSDAGTPRMPLNRAPLLTSQIEAIRIWINEGAIINN